MPILRCDAAGLRTAAEALNSGAAVILPTPSPLPYAVAGRSPTAVNGVKGRPLDQHVALWVSGGIGRVRSYLALNYQHVLGLEWLLADELVTVLVPIVNPGDCPTWLRPATHAGFALLAGAELPVMAKLQRGIDPLYVSSGNLTTHTPAATAAEADQAFNHQLLVIDGDAYRDLGKPHASSTMLRFAATGEIRIVRNGIHDAAGGPQNYLKDLVRRCPVEGFRAIEEQP